MASDTLSISKDLRAAGLTEQQADLLATHIASRPDDLATRQDLEVMKHELGLALADLDHKLTTESERLDHKLTSEIERLDGKLTSEIERLDGKLTSGIERLDHKIDQVAPQLLLKLGAGMVAGFGLTITAVGVAVGVLINQLA